MKIINTIFIQPIGATFIDWSIRLLSGSNNFYNIKQKRFIDITTQPITKINAHGHDRNEAHGNVNLKKYQNVFKQHKIHDYHSLITHPLPLDIVINQLYKNSTENYNIKKCQQYRKDDLQNILTQSHVNNDKVIILQLKNPLTLVGNNIRCNKTHDVINTSECNTDIERRNKYNYFFYNKHVDGWDNNNKHIWDKREHIALNLRLDENLFNNVDINNCNYMLYDYELHTNFNYIIHDLMKYLELTIVEDKIPYWEKIYMEWKKFHVLNLQYSLYFDYIIESIVHGYNFDLSRFKLDLYKEAMIQHMLIYKYNLNFKTWNLEKFPDNTIGLYNLLEENIHDTKIIY